MNTIAPNTPVDTSLELLGRTFSLPVIAAPVRLAARGSTPLDDHPLIYNACAQPLRRRRLRGDLVGGLLFGGLLIVRDVPARRSCARFAVV